MFYYKWHNNIFVKLSLISKSEKLSWNHSLVVQSLQNTVFHVFQSYRIALFTFILISVKGEWIYTTKELQTFEWQIQIILYNYTLQLNRRKILILKKNLFNSCNIKRFLFSSLPRGKLSFTCSIFFYKKFQINSKQGQISYLK